MSRRSKLQLASSLAAAIAALGCLGSIGQPGGKPARPSAGSDAEVVFDQIASIRRAQNATPPTWIGRLESLARDGASQLSGGTEGRVMANDLARRAAYNIGRNVEVWWMSADSLYGLEFPNGLVARRNLMLAVGVTLMRAGGTGRYAIVYVTPEPGQGL